MQVLRPYVPRLVIDWLQREPRRAHRAVDGSVLFADISGFTQLTETLAARGKIGAEEMGDLLNRVFDDVLAAAYRHGAGLVKWGGDAVLLLFDAPDHALRATAAASAMQRTMAKVGRLRTSCGPVQLGMSIGVHSGEIDFFLVGQHHRELVVTGPAATEVALLEKGADSGDIVVSRATAELLRSVGVAVDWPEKGAGLLLDAALDLAALPVVKEEPDADVDLSTALPAPIREHILHGQVESEHRPVAVGFVEFSGADALLAAEGAEALGAEIDHLVCLCQDAAERNGVTFLSSDLNADGGKVILISGAPLRAGDDEARVLTAMRWVLDGAGRLALRGGVTSGRVFAGDYGPTYRRNYSVAGDCVNLAARLMATAEHGQLLVTASLYDRVAGRFGGHPVPPFHVKGKREPIDAVAIERVLLDRARSEPVTAPLVGRAHELAILLELVEHIRAGHGRAVDLVGPGGIGKTRLIEELRTVSGCTTLWVDGDVYGDTTPYKPIRDFVRRQLELESDAPREEVADSFEALVRDQAPRMLPWLPLIGLAIDADFPITPEVADLDFGVRKERLEWAISELLGDLIDEPSLMVFNDAHLLDDATVDLLRRLTADAPRRPWLVIASYRPDDRAVVAEGATLVELEPLDTSATNELLAALTDATPLPSHQLAALATRAGGNPLYLRELVAGALDGDPDLPDSLEGVMAARIDRLAPARRRMLRAAAVLGMVVDLRLLADVLEADDGDATEAEALRELRELVADVDADRVQFRHHLVREAAYEGLSYRRRAQLHALTAQALEQQPGLDRDGQADLLSVHCFFGARYQDAWRYSVLAADRARAQYANAEAADGYDRALEAARRLRRGPRRDVSVVCESLGDVAFELGEFDRAGRALRRAHGHPGLPAPTTARLRMKIALVEEASGRLSSSLRWITKGLRAVEGQESDPARLVRGELTARYARVLHLQGRDGEAMRWAEQAVDQAALGGDDQTLAHALEIVDRSQVALGRITTDPPALRSLAVYEAQGDLCGQARIHNSLGMRAYFLGQWPSALDHYRAAEEAYRRAGREWSAATCQANIAEVLSDQGHLDEAKPLLEQAMRVWRGIGAASEVTFGEYLLGRIAARTGRPEDALALYDSARRYLVDAGEQAEVHLVDALRAECLALAGQSADALAAADGLLAEALAGRGLPPTVPLLHRIRAAALAALGRPAEAADALGQSVQTARRARGAPRGGARAPRPARARRGHGGRARRVGSRGGRADRAARSAARALPRARLLTGSGRDEGPTSRSAPRGFACPRQVSGCPSGRRRVPRCRCRAELADRTRCTDPTPA